MASGICLTTDRLVLRDPSEDDRSQLCALFVDPDFMVYTNDPCTQTSATARVDRMLANRAAAPFSKRPIIERASEAIVGYIGVAPFEFEGRPRLEFGYRLATSARGRGYATEAGRALLTEAGQRWQGTLMAMIDQSNNPSKRVIEKLGFSYWKDAEIDGRVDNLYELELP